MPEKTPEFNPDKYMSWQNPDTIGHRFKKNLYCPGHKSTNEKFREGYENVRWEKEDTGEEVSPIR